MITPSGSWVALTFCQPSAGARRTRAAAPQLAGAGVSLAVRPAEMVEQDCPPQRSADLRGRVEQARPDPGAGQQGPPEGQSVCWRRHRRAGLGHGRSRAGEFGSEMGRARCRSCPGQADMPRRRYFGEAPTARSRISVNPRPVPQAGVAPSGQSRSKSPGHDHPSYSAFATQMPLARRRCSVSCSKNSHNLEHPYGIEP